MHCAGTVHPLGEYEVLDGCLLTCRAYGALTLLRLPEGNLWTGLWLWDEEFSPHHCT